MNEPILFVEDDAELGAQIESHLRQAGFDATWTRTAEDFLDRFSGEYRLAILDLTLPGAGGLDVLKHIRTFSDIPVLILSARNDSFDKVRALKLGADDYLTKPFWPEELVERVKARLRRPVMQRQGADMVVGHLRINLDERSVHVDGASVELTRVEFELLAALAKRPGASVTRRVLAEAALDPEREGSERTLDVHMSRLRQKLGEPNSIATVWGIGYRLETGKDT